MKVRFDHVTKKYKSRDKKGEDVVAVDDFNFEIPDGVLAGLLGPSGCGKSTALNLLCGLETPTSGRIFFDEEDVTDIPPERRGVGMVFQSYALYPHMTVKENILFPLENLKGEEKMTKEAMEKKAYETACLVQIEELMERKPSQLSGGQQQRVAIARALVKTPRLLLLDEPLSNLDARLRLKTREEIRRIQRETGVTTVFVTHDQEEAMSISDLIILMKKGVFQQMGAPQEVYDNPDNLFVAQFLGIPQINTFLGTVRGGTVYIGNQAIASVPDVRDGDVYVAIRPEGFVVDVNGPLQTELLSVEVLGRDVSVLSKNENLVGETIRSIINSESRPELSGSTVRFSIKKGKMFLLDRETEEWVKTI